MAEYEKTRWLSRRAAAEYLSMEVDHLKRHVKSGKLPAPSFHLGPKSPRWDREALDAAIQGGQGQAEMYEEAVNDILSGKYSRRRKTDGGRELVPPNPQIVPEQPEPELARRQRLHKERLRKAAADAGAKKAGR
jgi:hypothetical protein